MAKNWLVFILMIKVYYIDQKSKINGEQPTDPLQNLQSLNNQNKTVLKVQSECLQQVLRFPDAEIRPIIHSKKGEIFISLL